MHLTWLVRFVAVALMAASQLAVALPLPENATSSCGSEQGGELECKLTCRDVARRAYPSF